MADNLTPPFYEAGEHLRYEIKSPTSIWVFSRDQISNSNEYLLSWFFDLGLGTKARGWFDRDSFDELKRYRTYNCNTISHANRITLAIACKV